MLSQPDQQKQHNMTSPKHWVTGKGINSCTDPQTELHTDSFFNKAHHLTFSHTVQHCLEKLSFDIVKYFSLQTYLSPPPLPRPYFVVSFEKRLCWIRPFSCAALASPASMTLHWNYLQTAKRNSSNKINPQTSLEQSQPRVHAVRPLPRVYTSDEISLYHSCGCYYCCVDYADI